MQIVLMASGTRGDVQPMIALGKRLKDIGHAVRIIAGSNFVSWIESHGLETYPTVDIEALMQSENGVKWVESVSPFEQLKYMKLLMHSVVDHTVEDSIKGTEGAELLIGGYVSEPYLQAIQEKRDVPLVTVALQPYRPTKTGQSSLYPILAESKSLLNQWAGYLTERVSWSVAEESLVPLRERLGLSKHNASSYIRAARQIPALYAFSRHVIPSVEDNHSYTTGYWFLDEAYTPARDLLDFLAAGDAPIYVGFGSMSSSDPEGTIGMIAAAVKRLGKRGVVAKGWSGADKIAIPESIFLLDKASHEWLFPKMAAVVHHGGAGTTAAGLRAGKPSLIIPHMADQPFWGRRVEALGVGVKAIPRHQLNEDNLVSGLEKLLNDSSIEKNADALGKAIRQEDGIGTALAWLAEKKLIRA